MICHNSRECVTRKHVTVLPARTALVCLSIFRTPHCSTPLLIKAHTGNMFEQAPRLAELSAVSSLFISFLWVRRLWFYDIDTNKTYLCLRTISSFVFTRGILSLWYTTKTNNYKVLNSILYRSSKSASLACSKLPHTYSSKYYTKLKHLRILVGNCAEACTEAFVQRTKQYTSDYTTQQRSVSTI